MSLFIKNKLKNKRSRINSNKKDLYLNISHLYDQDFHKIYKKTREFSSHIANKYLKGDKKINSILEIGVGTGKALEERIKTLNLKDGTEITCYDVSENMLSIAKKRLSKYPYKFKFVVADAMEVNNILSGKQYDLIVCEYLLSYVKEDFFERLLPLLSPTGMLYIVTTTQVSMSRTIKDIYEALDEVEANNVPWLKDWFNIKSMEEVRANRLIKLNHKEYKKFFQSHKLNIIHGCNKDIIVRANSFEEIWKYIYNDGWLVSVFPSHNKIIVMLVYFATFKVFTIMEKKKKNYFPYTDNMNVSFFLLKK